MNSTDTIRNGAKRSSVDNNGHCDDASEGPNGGSATAANAMDVSQVDVDFLRVVRDIFRTLEKEGGNDGSQRTKDSLEVSQKILELSRKMDKLRSDIYLLPGISTSKDEQLSRLRNLEKQIQMKRKLIDRYKTVTVGCGLSKSNILNTID